MSTINVFIKTLTGDLFAIEVEPLCGSTGLLTALTRAFPLVFRPSELDISFLRSLEDTEDDVVSQPFHDGMTLAPDETLMCLFEPLPPLASVAVSYTITWYNPNHNPIDEIIDAAPHPVLLYRVILFSLPRPAEALLSKNRNQNTPPHVIPDSDYFLRVAWNTSNNLYLLHLIAVNRSVIADGFLPQSIAIDDGHHLNYLENSLSTEYLPLIHVTHSSQHIKPGYLYAARLQPAVVDFALLAFKTHWINYPLHKAPLSRSLVHCPCGSIIRHSGLAAHKRTLKHIAFEKSAPPSTEESKLPEETHRTLQH